MHTSTVVTVGAIIQPTMGDKKWGQLSSCPKGHACQSRSVIAARVRERLMSSLMWR